MDTEKGETEILESKAPPRKPMTPWRRAWRRTSPGGKMLYWLYIVPLFAVMVTISLLAAIPYMSVRRTRPLLPRGAKTDPEYTLHSVYPGDDPRAHSKYEWYGPEKAYPRGTALTPLGNGPGLHRRTWEMYGSFREVWHMMLKQGLQVFGVLSAVILLFMQAEMMKHDFTAKAITEYKDAWSSGNADPGSRLRGDGKCAYVVGTGVANWATGHEPSVWYGCYHAFLCLLCICLFGDELLNIRFGCFAPQWTRAGIGYTIVFLVSATVTTSPNWGLSSSIHFRYVILIAIFLLGLYNLLRTFMAGVGVTSDGVRHTDYRVGRKPLRLWTESEWGDGYYRQNFIPYEYERYFWTEKLQSMLGDWNFPLERRTRENIAKQIARLEKEDPNYDPGRIQKVWARSALEFTEQRGTTNSRTVMHGGPKKMPYHMKNDLEQRKRIHLGPIDPDNLPTDEEEEEMIRVLNLDKGYFGIANWKPRTKSFGWWWFDIRRVWMIICSSALFGLRIGICFFDLSFSNVPGYRKEYEEVSKAWHDNGGPDESSCQYYQGSTVPILILPNGGSYTGVYTSLLWAGLYNSVLLGMCVAIILVAISNDLYWGMHWPFPSITLIGPRMTSMSMGITLGFVAFATLSQGFFFNNESLIILTKIVCYASVTGFLLSFFPNEPLRVNYTRDPFWPWLSRVAFRWLDRKKWHYSFKDAEDAQG